MNINKIDGRELNGDGIGYTELWDFSRANLNDESRIEAITTVASVCYANPNAVGKESLYNRLKAESIGLPSSSFEFVPVLIDLIRYSDINRAYHNYMETDDEFAIPDTLKYGEFVRDDRGNTYLLTNFRALLSDATRFGIKEMETWYNTEEECAIIAKHFTVFQSKIDINTRAQYIRHRASWQELSRRYVSGKKQAFEFYIEDDVSNVEIEYHGLVLTAETIADICTKFYNESLGQGCQPQQSRRMMPQGAYTTVWSAWQPNQLNKYFALRIDGHAQKEIRDLAEAQKEMLDASK